MSAYQFNSFATAQPITTSDTAGNHFRSLLVCAAGNIVFKPYNGGTTGSSITITGALVGSVIPVETAIVMATGTTATLAGLF